MSSSASLSAVWQHDASITLYPVSTPRRIQRIAVSSLHTLYLEEHGNPAGIPVVFLHGGPGAGFKPEHLHTFDPDAFRIVVFDQRGAGRSTPLAELHDNTTPSLIDDLEHIREQLDIDRWLVTGGSWGSCLALAYAEAYPERCLGVRLHGIFLGESADIEWWFQGSRTIFPDHWEDFAAFVDEDEREDLLSAYHARLTAPDPALRLEAAIRLRTFSAATQTFLPDPSHIERLIKPDAALPVARLFTHYCVHRAFFKPGQLIRNIGRIRHLPGEIVQARYDTVTPMTTAWSLHRAWPEAHFTIVTEANHASTKGPMAHALRTATDRLRDCLADGGFHPRTGDISGCRATP